MNFGSESDTGETHPTTAGADSNLGGHASDEVLVEATLTSSGAELDRSQEEVVRPNSTASQAGSEQALGDLPLANYRQLTVPEIIRQAAELSIKELRAVKDYEKSHRRRKTLLTKLERMLRTPRGSGESSGDVLDRS